MQSQNGIKILSKYFIQPFIFEVAKYLYKVSILFYFVNQMAYNYLHSYIDIVGYFRILEYVWILLFADTKRILARLNIC